MMEIKKYIVLLFISFLLGACSNYNQIIKGDDYQEKFRLANEMYEDKNYDRCIILYEQVYQHSPKTDEGEVAYYRLAKSYYQMEDFYMAGYYFSAYIQRFPYSVKNEEALFLTALCSVQNSPEFSLDQTETMTAINNVQQFVDRYPNSNLVDSCNHVIDRLRFKLELKEFEKVKSYSKTQYFRAAVSASDIFCANFPLSIFKEEANYIAVINCASYALNSIDSKKKERIEESIERYRNFAFEYPDSRYIRELDVLNRKIESELKLLTEN